MSCKSFFFFLKKKMLRKACKNNLLPRILNNFFFSFLKPSQLQNLDWSPKIYYFYEQHLLHKYQRFLLLHFGVTLAVSLPRITTFVFAFLFFFFFLLFFDFQFGHMDLFVGHLLCIIECKVVSSLFLILLFHLNLL